MEQYQITFLPSGQTIRVPAGTTVLDAEIQAGLQPDAPCGGQGKCGKCLVHIQTGPVTGIRKACTTRITGDMVVDTRKVSGHRILTSGASESIPVDPWLRVRPFRLPEIRLGEKVSNWERLLAALDCSGTEILPDLDLVSGLQSFCQEGNEGYAVLGKGRILSVTREKPECYLAAFDVGTTTIVGYLLHAETGEELASSSRLNPQSQYGADVILRSNYALEHSTEPLRRAVRQAICGILQDLCTRAGISAGQICHLSLVGNTCMSHLFLGISPDSLVHAPYHPAISQSLVLDAASLEIPIHPRGQVFILPNIAGFVGADTVGCMVSAGFAHRDEMTLLIDIGTNGEMVLGTRDRRVCCSTAAGPAFEGAKIACGMRGAEGAIDHVSLRDGVFSYSVIGGGAPRGICGSGLMDLVACLLDAGILDESGRLLTPDELESPAALRNSSCLQTVNGGRCFVIWQDGTQPPVYLSQKDIREVQLAKAAMAAGIQLLTEYLDISVAQIRHVLIAGAFGSYMDPRSACRIGLIPAELYDRIDAIGNAAGQGAKAAVLNREQWDTAGQLAADTEFLELATSPHFQDCFVDELEFPESMTSEEKGGSR